MVKQYIQNIQNGLSFLPMVLVMLGMLYVNLHKTLHTMTVETESKPSILYFPGTVQPKSFYTILSPLKGVVTDIKIQYGESVKKGDLLYILKSTDLADNYRQAIDGLTRATATYQKNRFQHTGNAELYKLGLISKVAYMDDTDQLESSELDLDEAKQKILKLLQQAGHSAIDLEQLSLEKIQDVRNILKNPIEEVEIFATNDGILYFPSKTFNDNEGASDGKGDQQQRLARGVMTQPGQVLAIIGNMYSMRLSINVSETDFHKLSMGQSASISGPAFEGITLNGKISDISRQANAAGTNTMPLYSIGIIVPNLTEKERQVIEVGMSATAAFTIKNPPEIRIPFDSIIEQNGSYFVKIIDKAKQIKEQRVVPGSTDEATIQILKGLSPGDQIVLSH